MPIKHSEKEPEKGNQQTRRRKVNEVVKNCVNHRVLIIAREKKSEARIIYRRRCGIIASHAPLPPNHRNVDENHWNRAEQKQNRRPASPAHKKMDTDKQSDEPYGKLYRRPR